MRAGWQVINWGESTFIQGGINAINPIDVSVLRVPGAELRDALLPVGAVKLSLKPSGSTSFEGFYQYTWERPKIDPVGSYFSTTDLAGGGRDEGDARLRVGARHDRRSATRRCRRPTARSASPCRRSTREEPSEQGQYGAALRDPRRRARRHGVRPLLRELPQPAAADHGEDRHGQRRAGRRGNYAATASYFLTYPEDIKLFGASFNTQLGRTGIALQGEVSHRRDVPLQMDDVELLYAALTPLRLLPPVPQLAPLIGLGTLLANNEPGGRLRLLAGDHGLPALQHDAGADDRHQGVQPAAAAPTRSCWWPKAAWSTVHDLPDQSVLRLEAPAPTPRGNRDPPDRRHPARHRAGLGLPDRRAPGATCWPGASSTTTRSAR